MPIPLRILIVEDSKSDAEFLLRELRKGGYEPISELVCTQAEMQAALEKQEWDVVVADYRMPVFSGLEALMVLRGRKLDIPFIIVSGFIGEETAVEMMKAGAHDYILKG